MLGTLILGLLAVAGLRVNAVHAPAPPAAGNPAVPGTTDAPPAPRPSYPPVPAVVPVPGGPPARPTGGALLAGTGARLLLLGATLTTYDVSSGVTTRPFGPDADGSVIGAAPLQDGDVVIESLGEASGRAYAVEDGRRRDLGVATAVTPGEGVDTAWLTATPESEGPNRVRLVNLAGGVLAGPYAIPADWRLERSVPGGVLVAIGAAREPYELRLWTPGQTAAGRLLAGNVVADASGGGQVLTVDAGGPVAVNGAPTRLPGDAVAYAVSADGSMLAALGTTSLTIVPRVPVPPGAGREVLALPSGATADALAYAPSGWLFVSLGTQVAAVAPGSFVLQAVPAVFSDPATELLAAAPIGKPANPRVGR